ncbi:hypothetical protein D9M69_601110 [compost metagenome]
MAAFLLELHQLCPHMVQQAKRQLPPRLGMHAFAVGGEIAHHLVQPVHANGGEMVAQRAEVAPGVGIETGVHVMLDHLALDLQALEGHAQQLVQPLGQALDIIPVEEAQTRAVDGHHPQ